MVSHIRMRLDRNPWIQIIGTGALVVAVAAMFVWPAQALGKTQNDAKTEDAAEAEQPLANPFPDGVRAPDFPKDAVWLNTRGPIRMQDLRGKFVLLDFWTYCCINCIHVLPELKKLEKAYPNELVVIGVHSAKFLAEKDTKNIEEAILRYEIEHPVVNDAEHRIWNTYGARSWPTIGLIDPTGRFVGRSTGEFRFEDLDRLFKAAIPYYRENKLLDERPIRFDLLANRQQPTPLRFPGKILADSAQKRLFISDSNHNRIVVANEDGQLLNIIGSGKIGSKDGPFDEAEFDHPQGCFLRGDQLYVADTENHLVRVADLTKKTVRTIAGIGSQARTAFPGADRLGRPGPNGFVGKPKETALNSPWALYIRDELLYIAMAGPHQIWTMPLDESAIGPYAGNGREDIVDGRLLPREAYQLAPENEVSFSSFAQPSGLAADKDWLYVADTEGSSIRAVPFDPRKQVRTVVGTAHFPNGRLFRFGDRDGKKMEVELQHAIGIAHHDGTLYITDTYNNKIKKIDAATGDTETLAGTGKPGRGDQPAEFDEPAGIAFSNGRLFVADTNNHLIRVVALDGSVSTLKIAGLQPPRVDTRSAPSFDGLPVSRVDAGKVQAVDGMLRVEIGLKLPDRWKVNDLAPAIAWVDAKQDAGPLDREQLGRIEMKLDDDRRLTLEIPVDGEGPDHFQIATPIYYCAEGGEGLCRMATAVWAVKCEVSKDNGPEAVKLDFDVK